MQNLINKIHHADCLEFMKQLPDKCIDLVLTDPPYFRVMTNEWDRQWPDIHAFQKWVGEIGEELQRVMKENGALYWFGDDKTIAYCQVMLDCRFSLINSLVWRKLDPVSQKTKGRLRSYAICTERCLFYEKQQNTSNYLKSIKEYMRCEREKIKAAKGFKTEKEFCEYVNKLTDSSSVVSRHYFSDSQYVFPTQEMYSRLQKSGFFRREYEDLRREYEDLRRVWNPHSGADEVLEYAHCQPPIYHPTQKPVPLISYLMERASNVGALVLDPFSGSGTTAIAAHTLGRRFICIERDSQYHAASVERLKEHQKQMLLPLFLPKFTWKEGRSDE